MERMAITAVPPELEDLSLRERRRRHEEAAEAESTPACEVCARPVGVARQRQQAKTCASEQCQREHRRRRRAREQPTMTARAANSIAMGNGTSASAEAAESPEKGSARACGPFFQAPADVADIRNAPSVDIGTPSQPDGRDRLGPVFHALMVAGATVTRLEVVVAGECWTVTRTMNGGPL
jgi:hypothetical protein